MSVFLIKPCELGEIDHLMALSKETYDRAFSAYNTLEDMEDYLMRAFSKKQLLAEMNDPQSFFYFGIYQNRRVGYLKFNEYNTPSEGHQGPSVEIQRLYVQSDAQNLRMGHFLMEEAIKMARDKGFTFMWLGVWEHNEKALRFYEKFNFKQIGSHTFLMGDDPQQDHLLGRTI
jgi:ribosomal protein S18 acetylase RimI-like enzyme|tara:strand:+ start:862 stop:1380 length:519 start_codon:yes stop_codon:yes gene_type:complete